MANKKGPLIGHVQSHETINAFTDTVKHEGTEFADDFFAQLVGLDRPHKSKSGEIVNLIEKQVVKAESGETIVFISESKTIASSEKKKSHEKSSKPEIRAAFDYAADILDTKKSAHKELRDVNDQVQQIMAELKKLISSSRVLQMEFAEVAVEQAPASVGQYHVNFFEWMLSVIRVARQKVEDSGAWLNNIKGKGSKKKLSYWGMLKKHGTSFGMSNERAVATQAG